MPGRRMSDARLDSGTAAATAFFQGWRKIVFAGKGEAEGRGQTCCQRVEVPGMAEPARRKHRADVVRLLAAERVDSVGSLVRRGKGDVRLHGL